MMAQLVKFWNKPRHRKRKALRDLAERCGVLDPIMRFRAKAAYALRAVTPRHGHGLSRSLVVTLTSYPPRFPTLHLTLKTLLAQAVKPDRVVLYIYDADFDSLPHNIRRLTGNLLDIRRVSQDLKSYKKLIPALRDFPEAIIVTADDDVRYRRSWLSAFVTAYDPAIREVLGRRAHRIRTDASGNILPYSAWEQRVEEMACADPSVLLTGVGGILYPPGIFWPDVMDAQAFMSLCPSADDIWFYFMARKNGVSCRKIGIAPKDYYWENSQNVALSTVNVEASGNDEAMARMVQRYGNPLDPDFGRRGLR